MTDKLSYINNALTKNEQLPSDKQPLQIPTFQDTHWHKVTVKTIK